MRRVWVMGAVTLFQTAWAQGTPETPGGAAPAQVVVAEARVEGRGLSLPRTEPTARVEVAALREGLRGDPFGAGATVPAERSVIETRTSDASQTKLSEEEGWMSSARWTAWLVGALGVIWFTGRRRRIP